MIDNMAMNNNIKITFPNSEKYYINGTLFPDVRVGMRKVKLMPTVSLNEKGEKVFRENDPVLVYDTSGAYGDKNAEIDLKRVS